MATTARSVGLAGGGDVDHGSPMSSYLLLVHGAWSGGWVWDDLAQRLEKVTE